MQNFELATNIYYRGKWYPIYIDCDFCNIKLIRNYRIQRFTSNYHKKGDLVLFYKHPSAELSRKCRNHKAFKTRKYLCATDPIYNKKYRDNYKSAGFKVYWSKEKQKCKKDPKYENELKHKLKIAALKRCMNIEYKCSTDPEYFKDYHNKKKRSSKKARDTVEVKCKNDSIYKETLKQKLKLGGKNAIKNIKNKCKNDPIYAERYYNNHVNGQKKAAITKAQNKKDYTQSSQEIRDREILKMHFYVISIHDCPFDWYPGIPDHVVYHNGIIYICETQGKYWHMDHAFNPDDLKDKLKLMELEEKSKVSPQAEKIKRQWKITDPLKRRLCKEHNVPLIEFWSILDVYDFIKEIKGISFLPVINKGGENK